MPISVKMTHVSTQMRHKHYTLVAPHEQSSLHTGVLNVGIDTIHFGTISKSGQQDPPAIWTHLKPIIEMIGEQNLQVKETRCSTVVRVFAIGAMGRRIDRLW